MTGHTCLDIKFDLFTWNPRHSAARGVLHAESILHSHMVRRTAGIESATFWSGVKIATRCFRIKKSGNVLAPDPCWKWIIFPDNFYPPPSGFNGRPFSTLYIGALILWPVYEGIFFILLFTINENGHWWMKNIWPKFRQKKSAIEMCRPPIIKWLLIT